MLPETAMFLYIFGFVCLVEQLVEESGNESQ